MTATSKRKQDQIRETEFMREQRRKRLRTIGLIAAGVILVGGAIGYVAVETLRGEQDKLRPDANPAEQTIPDEGAGHVAVGSSLTYAHYPPSSGTHFDQDAPEGFYEDPVAEGYWVHSLEHGDVVVLYNCPNDCPELKAKLRDLMNKAPKRRCDKLRLLIMPYSPGMTTPITLIAWGRQLDLAEYDEQAILNFYKRYEDRGPEVLPCQ